MCVLTPVHHVFEHGIVAHQVGRVLVDATQAPVMLWRSTLAMRAVERLELCFEDFGADSTYVNQNECVSKELGKWEEIWPESACGGSHAMIAGKVKECKERSSRLPCSNSIFETGVMITQCNSEKVCR